VQASTASVACARTVELHSSSAATAADDATSRQANRQPAGNGQKIELLLIAC
jgi:hypothetical protein